MAYLALPKQHVLGVLHRRLTDFLEFFFQMLRSMNAPTQRRASHAFLRGGSDDPPVLLQPRWRVWETGGLSCVSVRV